MRNFFFSILVAMSVTFPALAEPLFHESVHATLDSKYLKSRGWQKAQKTDGGFITQYAANNPMKEDLAEWALFAWTILVHPGRLPKRIETQAREIMPARLEFLESILLKDPKFYRVEEAKGC